MSLITDTQRDMAMAVGTLAKVDISKNKFNYYEHRKNAFRYIFLLIASIIVLFVTLFSVYDIALEIAVIYLIFDIVDFLFFPCDYIIANLTRQKCPMSVMRFPTPYAVSP